VDLVLSTYPEGDWAVVSVAGEVDVYTAPQLRQRLLDLGEQGRHRIVVDMDGVEFLDSTGLGVLVGGLRRVRHHGGALRLVCGQDRIVKIFRITGLDKVFDLYDSVDAAVAGE
jgi:anti-sigma B factor antagonist